MSSVLPVMATRMGWRECEGSVLGPDQEAMLGGGRGGGWQIVPLHPLFILAPGLNLPDSLWWSCMHGCCCLLYANKDSKIQGMLLLLLLVNFQQTIVFGLAAEFCSFWLSMSSKMLFCCLWGSIFFTIGIDFKLWGCFRDLSWRSTVWDLFDWKPIWQNKWSIYALDTRIVEFIQGLSWWWDGLGLSLLIILHHRKSSSAGLRPEKPVHKAARQMCSGSVLCVYTSKNLSLCNHFPGLSTVF